MKTAANFSYPSFRFKWLLNKKANFEVICMTRISLSTKLKDINSSLHRGLA
jgi:hypothetical protein